MLSNLKEKNLDDLLSILFIGTFYLFIAIGSIGNAIKSDWLIIISFLILLSIYIVFTIYPFIPKIMNLKRYTNIHLNEKLKSKFPEILNESFNIQDSKCILKVDNNQILFYGNYYLDKNTKNERFNENYRYAIDILNFHKKIK